MSLELFENLRDVDLNPKEVLTNQLRFELDLIEIKTGSDQSEVQNDIIKYVFFFNLPEKNIQLWTEQLTGIISIKNNSAGTKPILRFISWSKFSRLSVLSFENTTGSISFNKYYLLKVEIEDYNVMIDVQKFFDEPVQNHLRTFENTWKITTSQGDDYTTCFSHIVFISKW